ncbi:MAG: ATP-binding cassette domain-containing protein [Paracoccaceae bacterium]
MLQPTRSGACRAAGQHRTRCGRSSPRLLGPSEGGRVRRLRCLAGLERPTGGRITIGDALVHDSARGVTVPTHKHDIGMVFQSYAIWPHLTVFENVAFPLREVRPKIPEAREAMRSWCSLSGGERPLAASSAAASSSVWRWRARSCARPRWCCSTNPCRTSTPSCAPRPGLNCARW